MSAHMLALLCSTRALEHSAKDLPSLNLTPGKVLLSTLVSKPHIAFSKGASPLLGAYPIHRKKTWLNHFGLKCQTCSFFFPRKGTGHEASCTTRFYCKTWPCVRGGKNRPCSEIPGNPTPTVLMYVTPRLGQLDLRQNATGGPETLTSLLTSFSSNHTILLTILCITVRGTNLHGCLALRRSAIMNHTQR